MEVGGGDNGLCVDEVACVAGFPVHVGQSSFDEDDFVDVELFGDSFGDNHEREGCIFGTGCERVPDGLPFSIGGGDVFSDFPAVASAEPCDVVVVCPRHD